MALNFLSITKSDGYFYTKRGSVMWNSFLLVFCTVQFSCRKSGLIRYLGEIYCICIGTWARYLLASLQFLICKSGGGLNFNWKYLVFSGQLINVSLPFLNIICHIVLTWDQFLSLINCSPIPSDLRIPLDHCVLNWTNLGYILFQMGY